VVVSSGNYASFPASLSAGQALISVPAALLAVGADTLTANFTPSNPSSYNSASGTANVTVVASGAAVPVVTASSVAYSTGGYGSPFRALPLASGNVLVSVTAATSGMLVFGPAAGGGLQLSCFNYVRPAFVQDGASDFGMNLTPNGLDLAATLGVDGAIFYNLSTLETCTSTGLQVSQGSVASDQGSFDIVVTPDGKYAFVANEYGVASGATTEGNIGVIALQYDSAGIVTTGTTLVGQISTGGQAIAGVTISPDGSRLYVTSEVAGSSNSAAGANNPVLTNTNCVQQAGSAAQANGLLTVINVAAAEANPSPSAIITTVNAGCSPVRAVESDDGATLWVSARGDNRVLAFSTGMLEINPGNALLGYADTGGTAPVGLRLFDSGKLLAVANSNRFGTGTANATVLSVAVPAAASVVQTIPTGLFPREITVGADDRTLYLTNYNSGSFQVISTTVQ
jgi:DNA-binding beta-propeller fold protein YncE